MPGVVITTAVRTGPSTSTVRDSSQAFFVGFALRGPTTKAVKVESIADFEATYGGYQSYGYLQPTVETFFEEGGSQCYIVRIAGPAATSGVHKLLDDSAGDSLTLTANGPGDWSANMTFTVTAGSVANSVAVTLYYYGTEVFTTGNCTTVDQILGTINGSTVASRYVVAAGLGTGLPAVLGSTALTYSDQPSSGTTASTDDRSNVTTAQYTTALTLFNHAYGTGCVANPESAATAVYQGLIAHANTYNRIALLHPTATQTAAQAETFTETITAAESNLEHAACYFPWINVPTSTAGVTRLIPPDGYVAAVRARAHNQTGAHQPAAGIISNARWVVSTESEVDLTTGNTLDVALCNAIRVINGTIRIYGARSLSADNANFRYITGQDVVNGVVTQANAKLEDLVFSVIDGRSSIFNSIQARLIAILEPLREAGALYEAFDVNGKRIDSGYTVVCNAATNPTASLADGIVKAKIGLRVSGVGDKIEVDIIKSNLTSSVV
tara:strand:+ start:1105 stop:2595 length:1491 start_codon:yes stop_codon:yes gene_type:complete